MIYNILNLSTWLNNVRRKEKETFEEFIWLSNGVSVSVLARTTGHRSAHLDNFCAVGFTAFTRITSRKWQSAGRRQTGWATIGIGRQIFNGDDLRRRRQRNGTARLALLVFLVLGTCRLSQLPSGNGRSSTGDGRRRRKLSSKYRSWKIMNDCLLS